MSSQPVPVPAIAASELRHQLRTPLNHIIGYSEILLEEYPSGIHAGIIKSVLLEANEMVNSVHQVAGGDHQHLPPTALAQLREYLNPRIARVRGLVANASTALPAQAAEDLNRIALSAETLARTLADGAAPVAIQPHPMETPVEPRPVTFSGAGHILVVDDDEMNRDVLRRQLERQRHEVGMAADGATALDMLRARHFDVVLLDLMMPGMNGFEVLECIRRDPAFARVAVILISALDEMDSVVRSIEAGAEDYLFKPVNPTLLRARIKSTLDKQRAEESMQRKQRLESIGLLASGIAHDFNNLLTGIIGHAQLLEQALTEPDDVQMLESIVSAGERAAELTRQLLAYSGKGMFQMKPVDLVAAIHATEGLIHSCVPRKVRLQLNLAPVPPVIADESQLQQVILNLVLNAAEAIGADVSGSIWIETGIEKISADARFDVMPDEMTGGRYAWFEVRDSGSGMTAETVSKMFEPFFTTRFLGRGLGLAAVAGIVRAHRALLRVNTVPGQGTALRVCFPVSAEPEHCGDASDSGPHVLVVDDEPVVRQIVKVALERAGRRVLLADSGETAVDTFAKHREDVELVLLDWKMPVMDGSQTLAKLRAIRSDVRVIVSSGVAQSDAEAHFSGLQVTGFLQKPYRMSELVSLVDRSLPKHI